MIETRVRVTAAADGIAWVAATEGSGCGACQSREACGISGLGKYFARHQAAVPIPQTKARRGDEFLLHIEETDLMRAGFLAYLLPAALAISAAAGADAAGQGDAIAALAALLGLVFGLLISRWFAPLPRLLASPIPSSPTGASNE